MDPRDPRFNLRPRYDFSFSPRSIPYSLPPPPVAPSNYFSRPQLLPQFHPPPLPPPQFHHYPEDSRRYLTHPDSRHRDSRVYSLDRVDHRENRVFNERMAPDLAQLDWWRERERAGIRKDRYVEEESRVMVRKNEFLEENNDVARSRIRDYGSRVDNFSPRVNEVKLEKTDYFGNIGEKKWDNNGDGYFGEDKKQAFESGQNPPIMGFEQKTSALTRIQSGKSVWSRIKESAKNLQGSEEPKINLKFKNKNKFISKKMKNTEREKDRIIIGVSSKNPDDYTCNNPINSEMKTNATVSSEMPTCNSLKFMATGSSGMPIDNSLVLEAATSGTGTSSGSKAISGSLPSTVINSGLKMKATVSSNDSKAISSSLPSAVISNGLKMKAAGISNDSKAIAGTSNGSKAISSSFPSTVISNGLKMKAAGTSNDSKAIDGTSNDSKAISSSLPSTVISNGLKMKAAGTSNGSKAISSSLPSTVISNGLKMKAVGTSNGSKAISSTLPSTVISNGLKMKAGGANKQPMKKQPSKKFTKGFNSSYLRKGNSLVRKPTNNVAHHPVLPTNNVAHHPVLPFGVDEPKNKVDTQNEFIDAQKDTLVTQKDSLVAQKASLVTQKKSHDTLMQYSKPVSETSTLEPKPGTVELAINMDIENSVKSEPLSRKRMVYVKNRSNQLIAAPSKKNEKPSFSSLASDIYYMRHRNQLIRNASSSVNQRKQSETPDTDSSKLNHQLINIAGVSSRNGSSKKRLGKVQKKIHKHAKLSRVWTLTGQSDKKVSPYILPWKRMTYWRNLTSKNSLSSSKRSLSSISQKLQLTRKRDTIYTLSNDGFSLRKAKVVSVGRPNLKWSKSMDKVSKKANEEATLAVAEAERNKRERKRKRSNNVRKKGNSITQGSNSGIELHPGERVFRFGSIRYKMDASQHTLVRIGDEQPSDSVGQQSKKSTFVPRRLLIGNNEYIRKGNGNQLVRDPKKLVRMLASEKVRWSIHTARKRLAKKQQYCQFFTRFGKCNKISGKCPYIHDPDKVAICTKFLRGSCTNDACNLTHKIIPERMPDCSYYLQGLCTNLNCPYRHVHVNPEASVCDGFLKGFCANGDECRKKHSYVCPVFKATGECSQGSKCKLHHPKNVSRSSKKRKLSKTQNTSTTGRYFGSNVTEVSEKMMPTISSVKCDTDDFTDFISLDCDTDIDDGENIFTNDLCAKELDSDIDVHSDELDALIMPIRILNDVR